MPEDYGELKRGVFSLIERDIGVTLR